MREHKTQIWLRPDQCELVVDCLSFVFSKLNSELSPSGVHAMAARYTRERIKEVMALFPPLRSAVTVIDKNKSPAAQGLVSKEK